MTTDTNEHCEFLQNQVSDAVSRYEQSIEALRTAAQKMFTAKSDIDVWQKALESFTRDSDNSYQSMPIKEPSLIANPPYVIYEFSKEQSGSEEKVTESKKNIAPPVNIITTTKTKAGVMRQVMRENGEKMSIDDIFSKLPENLPMTITQADLWKMIPRFLKRKEIIRIERGLYKYNPDFLKVDNENRLFEENEQENSNK